MTVYRYRTEAVKGPAIATLVILALLLVIYLFMPKGFFAYFFMAILVLFLPLPYSGLVLRISADERKIVIARPLTRKSILFEDIAFCAVHGIEEGRFLIYAFTKEKYKGIYTVRGIRPKKPYEEIVRLVSKADEDIDLDINFNMAAKIPVSFVEKGEELKDRILAIVNERNERLMKAES